MGKYIFLALIVTVFILVFPLYETILCIVSIGFLLFLNKLYCNTIVKGFSIKRYIENTKIFSGDSTFAGLVVENKSIFPIVTWIYDYTSMELSFKQKESFFIFLFPKSSKIIKYRIIGSRRGDHHLGPTMVEFKDIFLMNTFWSKEYDTVDFVTVFPNILPHPEVDKSTLQPYGEIKNRLPIFEDLTKIQGIRDYREGDEIRKINWKISAKHNKLYVNYYNYSVSSSSAIILNLYHPDYDMKYPEFYEEFSIELATTLIFELHSYHQEIGILTNGEIKRKSSIKGGIIIENPLGFFEVPILGGNAHVSSIFELLARVYPQNRVSFSEMLKSMTLHLPWGSAIIVITPNLDEEMKLMLYDLSLKGHEVFIYNVHPNKNIEFAGSKSVKLYNTLKVESTTQIERVI
ncbi:MAG: DUF58 domain-containing protein [Brevinematia bacterium]